MNAIVEYQHRDMTKAEQLAYIYEQVASGRSLYTVLAEDDGLPSHSTFWRWHMDEEEVRDNLAGARANGADAIVEKAQHVAENPIEAIELMEEVGPDGVKRRRSVKEALGHRRLMIDTYFKRASMIAPRKYGPKLDLTSDGEKISSVAAAIADGNRRLAEMENDEAHG